MEKEYIDIIGIDNESSSKNWGDVSKLVTGDNYPAYGIVEIKDDIYTSFMEDEVWNSITNGEKWVFYKNFYMLHKL